MPRETPGSEGSSGSLRSSMSHCGGHRTPLCPISPPHHGHLWVSAGKGVRVGGGEKESFLLSDIVQNLILNRKLHQIYRDKRASTSDIMSVRICNV